ncbi:hypothetical protein NLX71_16655 [Paenibacillus sp. MZ04-78.2]|uniref:hypothetical protein n=1 Tax=Paenibacillus sp. MZ04-78.2 TaxID=2962034 RepID=UPI0020B785D2|nr:hypothetical protein [Paenibacillus sp. MZ04-78.2]MCP3774912.1 hypothetical protein [Paenibacillus sp. MZ04-78.2]
MKMKVEFVLLDKKGETVQRELEPEEIEILMELEAVRLPVGPNSTPKSLTIAEAQLDLCEATPFIRVEVLDPAAAKSSDSDDSDEEESFLDQLFK